MAEAVREAAALDLVLFVPNNRQPLKQWGPWATSEQRLRMLIAAVDDNPNFAVSEIELARGGPSFTADTLDMLHEQMPEAELHFILGADAADGLSEWRKPAHILSSYRLIVMSRPGSTTPNWTSLERIRSDARDFVQLIDVPRLEIASSELRARIAAGRSVRYLVPDAVLAIIQIEGLYRVPETA